MLGNGGGQPVRVFISYAHDHPEHEALVRELWVFLRACGIDARLDLAAAQDRVDWAAWMTREARDADRVLVIASPAYKRRAEGDAGPDEGRGVQWEARLIRDLFYDDQKAGIRRFVPVVLPGGSVKDIPLWLGPASTTHYQVSEFTVAGAESLLRALTNQPAVLVPDLGTVPVLPPLTVGTPTAVVAAGRPGVHIEVVIEASVSDGVAESAVWAAGSLAGRSQGPVPPEVDGVWTALGLPGPVAAERLAAAGRALAGALLGPDAEVVVAGLLEQMTAQDTAEVVLCADGDAFGLPVELLRLRTAGDRETEPLGLLPAVAVSRRLLPPRGQGDAPPPRPPARPALAGPLKVLAAVAAPEETKTANPPLDTEAEMAAVLNAVAGIAAGGQVRILEVASLAAIRTALETGAYHVLHLSAHGSAESVELEDEDGNPVTVGLADLVKALQLAGRVVPLIVLSSCSGGASGSGALAAGLAGRGADRVIAMLAPVTDGYATVLAGQLYRQLTAHPELTVGQALARARALAEETRPREKDRVPVPEFGVVTLVAAGGDGPLTDPALPAVPLTVATSRRVGRGVRELPIGELIGRRAQLRDVAGVLRRDERAVEKFGAAAGVVLTGIGGIGKTALAGRVMARLADEGWLVAVHEGRWSPATLIASTARAAATAAGTSADPGGMLAAAAGLLADPGRDDVPKLSVIGQLLGNVRLLVVLDDFEQNLTVGGSAFLDPAAAEALTALAAAADPGAVLVTCRYPLPGPDRFLVPVPIPPLSRAELRRMFLRLPALRNLDIGQRRLLMRVIGGHPRLIQFTDALLRGGKSSLMPVQVKLRDLAARRGLDLDTRPGLDQALDQAMLLGSTDIVLTELLALLTPAQHAILRQVAVCRAPMTRDDLASTLTRGPGETDPAPDAAVLRGLAGDVERLTDLTLLTAGDQIVMHPWTAAQITRHLPNDLNREHERALAMRYRRFTQQRGTLEDFTDIARHLAALHRYDDVADLADQAMQIVPGTLSLVACLAEMRLLIPQDQRNSMVIAVYEVDALLRAGDLPSATQHLRVIREQAEAQVMADPVDSQAQRLLAVIHERLGDIAIATGNLTAAQISYQASLAIAERLAAADPAHAERQRFMSVTRNKLGDVAVAAGDLAAARAAYQAALDIRTRLAAADPANSGWQRDLSVSHEKLGDVAVAAGDLAAARAAYQAVLDIRTRLAAADPANSGWQRDLSVSHNKLGDVAVAAGDLAAARAAYQAALDIAVRLAAADPANSGWQRDLEIMQQRITSLGD